MMILIPKDINIINSGCAYFFEIIFNCYLTS
jgi:hypothetical protein